MNEIDRAVSEVERLKAELEKAEKEMNTLIKKEEWKTDQKQIIKDNRIKTKMTRNRMENEYLELFPDTELANSIISGEDYEFNLVIRALKNAPRILKQIRIIEQDIEGRKERYGEGYNEETDEWTKLKKQDIADLEKELNAIVNEQSSVDEVENEKQEQIKQRRLERKLKENKEKFNSKTSDIQNYDIAEKAAQMTEEEMNYILELQKIATEKGVSLSEAEVLYNKNNETSKPEPSVEPTIEKSEKEKVAPKARIKSTGELVTVLEKNSSGDYVVKLEGSEQMGIISVPASDLDIVDENESIKDNPQVENPGNVDVNAKPGLKDTMTISTEDVQKALRVSEEKESKPRRLVVSIANRINERFKKARECGKKAIDNFFKRNSDYSNDIPSKESLEKQYADSNIGDDVSMQAEVSDIPSKYDPEPIERDPNDNSSNRVNM